MKRLVGVLTILVGLFISSFFTLGASQSAIAANFSSPVLTSSPVLAAELNAVDEKRVELGDKIDLNNTNVRAFTRYPGMYPNIASMIIRNAPFNSVDDVFNMPGLTERQKEVLRSYQNILTVTDPDDALTEGGDRFNNGIYGG
jgi:photosystem II PsbU protein